MPHSTIQIISDSQYAVKGINEWMIGWANKNWRGTSGKIKNAEMWMEVYRLWNQRSNSSIVWVKGHSGNTMNELADEFANYGSDGILTKNITIDAKTTLIHEGVFNQYGQREKV